ncbi:hypothetical protein ALP94_01242, partial [Pseudomonas savastanoi pv. glycinea]
QARLPHVLRLTHALGAVPNLWETLCWPANLWELSLLAMNDDAV